MIRGASPATVEGALRRREPLPGTRGFAGDVRPDERPALVRDVLGRDIAFSEADDATAWAFDPGELDEPVPVPAGHVRTSAGEARAWTLPPVPPVADPDAAVDAVRRAVWTSADAVRSDGIAVAFSGGVDSAVVAAGVPDAPCYVTGFPDAHDVESARAAAAAMERDLRVIELTHERLRRAVRAVAVATGRTNPMDVAIAAPLYLVAERVAADGYDRLAVGQGADELFGGYAKVVDPADDHRVAAETVRGATRETMATLPDQLERDVLTLRAAGVEPVAPLLHDRVVEAALGLPDELLATRTERKVALRRAARDRLPATVAGADKKALQYGSLVSRELDRLARQAGFKRRMDDHVGRYVRSLLD